MFYDVIISGAGLSGRLLACGLQARGLNVLLVEKSSSIPSDTRTSALSYSSFKALQSIGVWPKLKNHAAPINDILISSNDRSSAFIHYDNELVMGLPMGYTVPNAAIWDALQSFDLNILTNERCIGFTENNSSVKVTLESGKVIDGKILVVAEGRNSSLAEKLKIKIKRFSYNQSCIITNIMHEKAHKNIATEILCESGPFAVLPTINQTRSAIIWTEHNETAKEVAMMDKKTLIAELNRRCELGVIDVDPMVYYAVSLSFVTEYYRGRVVLFGDTLHSIHPVAGQGLNLSIGDMVALLNSLDLGLGSQLMLKHFFQKCIAKNLLMIGMTDLLIRMFAKRNPLLRFFRNLGMSMINESDLAKEFFMRRAMGI